MRRNVSTSFVWVLLLIILPLPASSKMTRPPASFALRAADLATVNTVDMPALDNTALLAKAESSSGKGRPWLFAEPIAVRLDLGTAATQETLDDGSRLLRLRVRSPGARHVNLGFSTFELPDGASLWLYDPQGQSIEGPYTSRDSSDRGRFFSPIIRGDEVVIELHLTADSSEDWKVELGWVNHGFRGFGTEPAGLFEKSHGSCNNDVICPEGDPWRDQIRSVARYTINGNTLCTGQLVNNTAHDNRPLFLSAFHCGVDASNDDTVVVYWNFEAPVCGQQDGGSLADNQSGSRFRAGDEASDFVLLELDQDPDPDFDVYFAGWDVRGRVPDGSVTIHHPAGHVKSISFNDDPLTTTDYNGPNTHWEVDNWEDGTTEGGSSGACLYDPDSQLCIGVLTAGLASCEVIDFDIFGKLSVAWTGGGTRTTRLRNWLDPLSSGTRQLEGRNPDDEIPGPEPKPTGPCEPDTDTLCLRDGRFTVEGEWRDFEGNTGNIEVTELQSEDSGVLYFFDPDNWEMLVKILDGCALTNHFWVFAAATTTVEYTLTVTDTTTGDSKSYTNPLGQASPAITDTDALATCGGDSIRSAPLADVERAAQTALEELTAAVTSSQHATIATTSASVGATKATALPKGDSCPTQALSCGQTVTGTLTTNDCALEDGTFADYWTFNPGTANEITANLTSEDFDTFLFLLDPTTTVVATDDDSGTGTNSQLQYTLGESGDWTLVANNFAELTGDPGDYTLSLQCDEGTTPPVGSCQPDDNTMCLQNDRFTVSVDWRSPQGGTGVASIVPVQSDDSGVLYFFDPDNWEMLLKVLNGCALNDHYWVFAAATTNVEYTLTVTDTQTNTTRQYFNPLGQASPAITDTEAFATCP